MKVDKFQIALQLRNELQQITRAICPEANSNSHFGSLTFCNLRLFLSSNICFLFCHVKIFPYYTLQAIFVLHNKKKKDLGYEYYKYWLSNAFQEQTHGN